MRRLIRNRKGGVTTAWVGSIPVFVLFALFIGAIAIAWGSHSAAQVAADAGALAATKKMDEWIGLAVEDEIRNLLGNDFSDEAIEEAFPEDSKLKEALLEGKPLDELPIDEVLDDLFDGNEQLIREFLDKVFYEHNQELAATVRDYVKQNGGDDEGKIIIPVHDRVKVEARTRYQPVIFKEYFSNTYVEGDGYGPKRMYLKLLPEKMVEINY
jgi:Putative Flp pilus-assembly TadE/G-like